MNAIPKLTTDIISRIKNAFKQGKCRECWPLIDIQLWIRGHNYLTRRLVYYLIMGKDPYPYYLGQACNNSNCCNPFHYILINGRQLQVNRRKERRPKKLCQFYVRLIKLSKLPTRWIAEFFGVNESTIRRIRKGILWKNVK